MDSPTLILPWLNCSKNSLRWIINGACRGNTLICLVLILSWSKYVVPVFVRYILNTSVPQGSEDPALARQQKTRKRTLRIVIAMTVAFFVSWSPYALSSLIGAAIGHESIVPAYSMIPELMAKASVIYNPILYVLLNSKFRVTLLNLCSCSWNRVGNGSTENSDMGRESSTNAIEIRRTDALHHRDL